MELLLTRLIVCEIKKVIEETTENTYLTLDLRTWQDISNAAAKQKHWNDYERAQELITVSRNQFRVYYAYPEMLSYDVYQSLSNEVCLHAIKMLSPYVRKLFQEAECEMHWQLRIRILDKYKEVEKLLLLMYGTYCQRDLFMYPTTLRAYYNLKKVVDTVINEFDVFLEYRIQLLAASIPQLP